MFRLSILIAIGLATSALGWIKVPDNYPGRIVGGQDAAPNQFPYQASLRDANMGHFCGGTIINNCYILSAAHCDPDGTDTKFVVVGSILLDNGGATHEVVRVINHPNFSDVTGEHDINLVKVSPYITYNAAVQPMPIAAHYAESGPAVVSGWGHLVTGGPSPNHLQFLNTEIISFEDCYDAYYGDPHSFEIFNTTICTTNPAGQGACQGDSGGPLVHNGGLHGVVSWGSIECGDGRPDVNTRVAFYVSWILANAV
ncbi:chymotrypsin-2-like [Anopheles ziemanni]|uniref:chymotrypsin-2-like n=1 Tax=Anopheles coustani TaxID=139045 RepID=UPI002658DE6C|nr:chymotrypsin-2-like [Anopheles coustani]XP_058170760.1 chymotrypsin-2-like [Anopheles ziemanni]